MLAYKFLDRHGCTLFRAVRWPLPQDDGPGPWLEAAAARPCREGIHACRPQDLAYWVQHELWEIELDGAVVEAERKVVARRGRLVRRLDAWAEHVGKDLGTWCAWRSREHAIVILERIGDQDWARELAQAVTLDELREVGRRAATALDSDSAPGSAAGLAADAAQLALTDLIAEAPFVAACAAGHAATFAGGSRHDFDLAYIAERRAQSDWVSTQLNLT